MDEDSPSSHPRGNNVSIGYDAASSRRPSEATETGTAAASPMASKPKRVRTGCLTCRNRHLKCDEALPVCVNCQKSNRKCERGVRLNFIDLKVEQPPYLLPPVDWKVQFQDESRQIASEYVGGLARYAKLRQQVATPPHENVHIEQQTQRVDAPMLSGPGHFSDNSRVLHPQLTQSIPFSGVITRPLYEPSYAGYDDPTVQPYSRKNSDAFVAMGSGSTPTSSHSGVGGRTASFSLGAANGQQSLRDDHVRIFHAYKASDASSVASSLVPQGVAASSSGSYRNATGSGAPDPHEGLMTPQSERNGERDYLNSAEELHYMQVFVDEVAVWMDSLDNQKHFGRVIPYLALKSPMLLNAFLACGVKHLTLVDGGSYKDDKALYYYDTATTQLLRSLQNPERNTAECATTAVVLNVYEIMSEKPAARMNHIAGARALIRECKWDARSTGIGAACFWLNVGMEVLSCLAFNWATAWDPDHWGMNPEELMDMTSDDKNLGAAHGTRASSANEDSLWTTGDVAGVGQEEIWLHRILYIVAKLANFRANTPQFQEPSPHDEQVRQQGRFREWQKLKNWCDTWNAHCPRSMRPYGYLYASSTNSAFPNVWLIKRSAIVGRLFYHTAMCLLAQINPLRSSHHDDENRTVQLHHAHQVCGIAAHTKDHGVASVAIRSLAIAGSVLSESRERHEVLDILSRIQLRSGWNLGRVNLELKRAWGWEAPDPLAVSGPASAAGLPPPRPPATIIVPSARGGTLGAAAVMDQLFGPRDGPTSAATTPSPLDSRRPSEPRHQITLASGSLGTGSLLSYASRHNSVAAASPSSHASPGGTTAHTPSSTTGYAMTPPSRSTVNPLLAQADFNQPNHPYREWYKPPERTPEVTTPTGTTTATGTTNGTTLGSISRTRSTFGGSGGGLWPY